MKSPLRYPGGKTRAVKILKKYASQYFFGRKIILSPFFGGGSFEISMKNDNCKILANDLFIPLYNFWNIIKTNQKDVSEIVKQEIPVTKEKFIEFRNNIMNFNSIKQAALYYIINRCSFSGSTFCGGFSQQAAEGRLTNSSIKNLETINLDDIDFFNMDCCDFLDAHPENSNTFIYADPPYYIKNYMYGKDGDLHENFDHLKFSKNLKKRKDWILSYNDCEYIRNLYSDCRIFKEKWSYGMNTTKESSELIIIPPL